MASTDAIACLSDTLVALLQGGLAGLVLPANVTLSTPVEFKDFSPRQPAVTVFLYQVGIAGELRNAARRSTATGTRQRPPLPLEVRFLVTPWTQVPRDAYRIIGAISLLFHDHAALGFSELLGNAWAPDDTVELVLESLPADEHYDIWDPTDVPYRLSLAYLARIVGVDSTLEGSAAPVLVANVPQGA